VATGPSNSLDSRNGGVAALERGVIEPAERGPAGKLAGQVVARMPEPAGGMCKAPPCMQLARVAIFLIKWQASVRVGGEEQTARTRGVGGFLVLPAYSVHEPQPIIHMM